MGGFGRRISYRINIAHKKITFIFYAVPVILDEECLTESKENLCSAVKLPVLILVVMRTEPILQPKGFVL